MNPLKPVVAEHLLETREEKQRLKEVRDPRTRYERKADALDEAEHARQDAEHAAANAVMLAPLLSE